MRADVLALAQALIRCPSVTPAEGGALTLIGDVLSEAGFAVHRPVFSAPGMPDVHNLYARFGTGRPCLVFAGHTDVVPPGDAGRWRHDPFGGVTADGFLHGRGAVDMKGAVAASLAAALAFVRERPSFAGSIAVLLTGDEEGPAVNGTVKLLAWCAERGERFDHCVLGEPTNPERLGDTVKIGRRGSLTGRIQVEGRQGHVAYPHLAVNPIPVLARIVSRLGEDVLDGGTDHFDPSHLEWTSVDVGNPATNVVPAIATAVFNIRFNDRWTPESLAAEIGSRVEKVDPTDATVALSFDPTNALAFVTEPGPFVELVRDAVEAETGRRPALSTTGGTSDARFIQAYCPVVECGLVGQTMHAIDERVRVDDLECLERIYRRLLESYFTAEVSSPPVAR